MKTNAEIAAELVENAKVDLGDGTWTPNEPLEFDFPYDGALDKFGGTDTTKAELAATALIDQAFRDIGWFPVNLPWDEDGAPVIEPIDDELNGIFITVNFRVPEGGMTQSVSRDWLLFPDEAKETAYRVVM